MSILLNNGLRIPQFGVGTFRLTGEKCEEIINYALSQNISYHIDSASIYKNEKEIGVVIQKCVDNNLLQREDLYIVTKLSPYEMGYEKAKLALERSLTSLNTSYIDLYLIHWPSVSKIPIDSPKHAEIRKETWRAMEEFCKAGKCKSIGVSNYTISHLEELLSYATIIPVINQVEFHPKLYQSDLLQYCESKSIKITAYASLGSSQLICDPIISSIAQKYSKTNAQILLRWGIQHGVVVIPKTTSIYRLQENSKIFNFALSDEDMKILNQMNDGTHYCWDPSNVK